MAKSDIHGGKVKKRKNDFDDEKPWAGFYGNGSVYIGRKSKVLRVRGANFDIERLKDAKGSRDEYWIGREVVVALGSDVSKGQAIKSLSVILAVLQDSSKP